MDILFSEGSQKQTTQLSEETIKDIALYEIINQMSTDALELKILQKIMTAIPCDWADMMFRQNIIKDLFENQELCNKLNTILAQINILKDYGGFRKVQMDKDYSLYSLLQELRELVVYVNIVEDLYNALLENEITSQGLISLRNYLEKIVKDEKFCVAKKDITVMHENLSNVRGALIGINFTPDLNIENVSAVEFVPHRIRSNYTLADIAVGSKLSSALHFQRIDDPLLVGLAPKLEKHLKKHYYEIKKTLSKYIDYDSSFITEMYEGLTFYIKSAEFGHKLKNKGYEFCFPQIKQDTNNKLTATDFYNIRLAVSDEENIVKNDFAFTKQEHLFILTGPNRGGKTIVEQALGLISVMMSLGMFVTAKTCTGLPFKNILTHFPIDENLTINYGRLGEEAVRIKEIVKLADKNTLILFNETFSTTSSADALYLSMDLLHVLKDKGSSVIFNTHIHELVDKVPDMNKWDGEGNITSLVMEIKDNVNTFKLKQGIPDTGSYAYNIALKYGITYEQMKKASTAD